MGLGAGGVEGRGGAEEQWVGLGCSGRGQGTAGWGWSRAGPRPTSGEAGPSWSRHQRHPQDQEGQGKWKGLRDLEAIRETRAAAEPRNTPAHPPHTSSRDTALGLANSKIPVEVYPKTLLSGSLLFLNDHC